MYEENETLVTVEDIGEEGTEKFIPKGTKVVFLKAIDNMSDLSKSKVYIRYGKRGLVVPEIAVKPLDDKKLDSALAEFNKAFMELNPELKKYHPNFFIRSYYKIIYFFKDLFSGSKKKS